MCASQQLEPAGRDGRALLLPRRTTSPKFYRSKEEENGGRWHDRIIVAAEGPAEDDTVVPNTRTEDARAPGAHAAARSTGDDFPYRFIPSS